jgi:hypothetical protein
MFTCCSSLFTFGFIATQPNTIPTPRASVFGNSDISKVLISALHATGISPTSLTTCLAICQRAYVRHARVFGSRFGLTVDQIYSILLYTCDTGTSAPSQFYYILNKALRESSSDAGRASLFDKYIAIFKGGVALLPAIATAAFRGLSYRVGYDVREIVRDEYTLGRTVCFQSVTSTSSDENISRSFITNGVLLKISLLHGRDINQLSCIPNESEVIVVPGTRFRVTRTFYDDSGMPCADLQEEHSSISVPSDFRT